MENVIEVENLTKSFQKRRSKEVVQAVKGISFTVNKGEVLGLLGPNGAGKTTTIKMICGLLQPDAGTIKINGKNNQQKRLETLREISAVLEGNRNLYWRLTVRENLEYFAGNRGLSRKSVAPAIDELLNQFDLKEKENELVNRLSRGMQQKLAIAVAMLADSDVILLDEPTLGLDVETSYEVRNILHNIAKDQQRTIIISTHDMDVVQDLCERTIIINNGEIITDDKVDHLLELFEVRSYTIQLNDLLSDQQQKLMAEKFASYKYIPDTYQSVIEVDLAQSDEIFHLFEILQMEKTAVESIDKGTINFEKVFLKIIQGEN